MSENGKWVDHMATNLDSKYTLDFDDHDQPKSASDNLAFCYEDPEQHYQDSVSPGSRDGSLHADSATIIKQARESETPPTFVGASDLLGSKRQPARVSVPLKKAPASPPPSLEVPPPPPNSPAAKAYACYATMPTSPLLPLLPLLAEAYSRNVRNSSRRTSTSKQASSRYAHTTKTKNYGETRFGSISSKQGKHKLKKTIQLVHRSRHQ